MVHVCARTPRFLTLHKRQEISLPAAKFLGVERKTSFSECMLGFGCQKMVVTAKYASWFGVSVIKKQNLLSKLECCHKLEQIFVSELRGRGCPLFCAGVSQQPAKSAAE
jgi:hypothetical protein